MEILKWFCRMGLHSWNEGLCSDMLNPIMRVCRRCDRAEHFVMWVGWVRAVYTQGGPCETGPFVPRTDRR